MSSLSPRLQVRVQQKQILTPGLVQMVSLLQLNRLELKEMISAEVAQNPVLEESTEGGEEDKMMMTSWSFLARLRIFPATSYPSIAGMF